MNLAKYCNALHHTRLAKRTTFDAVMHVHDIAAENTYLDEEQGGGVCTRKRNSDLVGIETVLPDDTLLEAISGLIVRTTVRTTARFYVGGPN